MTTTSTNQVHMNPNIKVTDRRYGRKTAMRLAYEKQQREQYEDQRRAGLRRQIDGINAKLVSLRHDISVVIAKLETGVITGPGPVNEAFAALERKGALERKWINDIARLTNKIGA